MRSEYTYSLLWPRLHLVSLFHICVFSSEFHIFSNFSFFFCAFNCWLTIRTTTDDYKLTTCLRDFFLRFDLSFWLSSMIHDSLLTNTAAMFALRSRQSVLTMLIFFEVRECMWVFVNPSEKAGFLSNATQNARKYESSTMQAHVLWLLCLFQLVANSAMFGRLNEGS